MGVYVNLEVFSKDESVDITNEIYSTLKDISTKCNELNIDEFLDLGYGTCNITINNEERTITITIQKDIQGIGETCINVSLRKTGNAEKTLRELGEALKVKFNKTLSITLQPNDTYNKYETL